MCFAPTGTFTNRWRALNFGSQKCHHYSLGQFGQTNTESREEKGHTKLRNKWTCPQINFVNCFLFVWVAIFVNELFWLPRNKLQSPPSRFNLDCLQMTWCTAIELAKPNMIWWSAMNVPTGNSSWSFQADHRSVMMMHLLRWLTAHITSKQLPRNRSPKHIYENRFKECTLTYPQCNEKCKQGAMCNLSTEVPLPPPQIYLSQLTFHRCPAKKVKQKSFLFEIKSCHSNTTFWRKIQSILLFQLKCASMKSGRYTTKVWSSLWLWICP